MLCLVGILGIVYAEKKTSELGKDQSYLTLFLAKTPNSGFAVVRACTEKRSELKGKNIGPKKLDPQRPLSLTIKMDTAKQEKRTAHDPPLLRRR